MARVQAEVAAPVLVGDPGRRLHDPRAEARVVRLDQADRAAARVHDRKEDRASARRVRGGHRPRSPPRIDRRGELRTVRAVQEVFDGDAGERRVGQERVAVRQRALGRLDPRVHPADARARRAATVSRHELGGGGRRQCPENVEHLEPRHAGAVGRMGGRRDAAIVQAERRLPGRLVAREIRGGAGGAGRREPGGLARRDLPGVEIGQPGGREPLQGRPKGRKPNPLAKVPWPPVGPVDGVPAACQRPEGRVEDRAGCLDRPHEMLVGREAAPGQLDRGGQQRGNRQVPPARMRVGPGPNRAGDRDRERPAKGQRRQPAGPEGFRVRARRSAARPVERGLGARGLVPDEPERVAPEAARLAHHDGENRVRRDRGVDRAAALPEDAEASRGRQVMRGDHGARAAAGERHRGKRPDRVHGSAF